MYITICEIDHQSRFDTRQGDQGWCTGMTLRDGMGKEVEEGFRMGDTCTPMFITALFMIARTWKQPRYLSADEWIRSYGTYTQWNITQTLKRIHLNQF